MQHDQKRSLIRIDLRHLMTSSKGIKDLENSSFIQNKLSNLAFSTRQKNKNNRQGGYAGEVQKPKPKFVKPIDVGAYTISKEPILKLENGYYLLYYHRQKSYTLLMLYMKLLIPLLLVLYVIKKNPFYKSYPAVLPL